MRKKKQHAMRRQRLFRAVKRDLGVQAVYITNPNDIRYLSGCTEGAGALLLTDAAAVLFVGKMFEFRAPKEAPDCEQVVNKLSACEEAAAYLKGRRVRKVGFQGTTLAWAQEQALAKAMGNRKLIDIGNAVLEQRAIKDEQELAVIRKCVRIAEKAFLELIGQGAAYLIGLPEKALAAELEFRMRMLGADRQGFPQNGIIVASGPNSSSCHHVPTLRKAHRGEPILFDWGAECDGYRSDITRVVFLGEPKERFRDIYEAVLQAHDTGVGAVRPGAACDRVSEAAWDVVRRAGHGETIRHGLGHGIGLDVHEWPSLGAKPRDGRSIVLRKNMVVTVEPGIYYEGLGGVRIEDDILVTARGHERLNKLPRSIDRMILR